MTTHQPTINTLARDMALLNGPAILSYDCSPQAINALHTTFYQLLMGCLAAATQQSGPPGSGVTLRQRTALHNHLVYDCGRKIAGDIERVYHLPKGRLSNEVPVFAGYVLAAFLIERVITARVYEKLARSLKTVYFLTTVTKSNWVVTERPGDSAFLSAFEAPLDLIETAASGIAYEWATDRLGV